MGMCAVPKRRKAQCINGVQDLHLKMRVVLPLICAQCRKHATEQPPSRLFHGQATLRIPWPSEAPKPLPPASKHTAQEQQKKKAAAAAAKSGQDLQQASNKRGLAATVQPTSSQEEQTKRKGAPLSHPIQLDKPPASSQDRPAISHFSVANVTGAAQPLSTKQQQQQQQQQQGGKGARRRWNEPPAAAPAPAAPATKEKRPDTGSNYYAEETCVASASDSSFAGYSSAAAMHSSLFSTPLMIRKGSLNRRKGYGKQSYERFKRKHFAAAMHFIRQSFTVLMIIKESLSGSAAEFAEFVSITPGGVSKCRPWGVWMQRYRRSTQTSRIATMQDALLHGEVRYMQPAAGARQMDGELREEQIGVLTVWIESPSPLAALLQMLA
eukprot:1137203-Pelagomonas_calceolata.AAC.4